MATQYCRFCHFEGCTGVGIPKRKKGGRDEQTKKCEFFNAMGGEDRDKSMDLRKLAMRRNDPMKNPSELFLDRVKLLKRHQAELRIVPLPKPVSVIMSDATSLNDEQVLAYARAYKLYPDGRLKEDHKLEDLRDKVKGAIKGSGKLLDQIEGEMFYKASLVLECDDSENSVDGFTDPLAHLTSSGYPNKFTDPVQILGKPCEYPKCKGKYVWTDFPKPKARPRGRGRKPKKPKKKSPPPPRSSSR